MLEASSFLNKGTVLEIFSTLGKMPVYNNWFIINANGLIMLCFIYFSILEIFSALGKMPVYNIWFIINANGSIMLCFIYFSILLEMSYLPELLLLSNLFSFVNMSSPVTSSHLQD